MGDFYLNTMINNLRKYGLFINGKEVEAFSGTTYHRENPATEEPIAEIAQANREDIDHAVKSAQNAFEKWSCTPPVERAKIIYKIAELLEKYRKELAVVNTLET
ncbi:MAG: aldehyde dehydrogenase family protein, partial [Candidatus Bathyarchaeota archaeon]|nr:aldehyde dehydrogenase family protein [Candidatus Bathyarchaeota archaeon]